MLKRASRTSLSVAESAVTHARMLQDLHVKLTLLPALIAAVKLLFPSSPQKAEMFYVTLASDSQKKTHN